MNLICIAWFYTFLPCALSTVLGWSTYDMIGTGTGAKENEPCHISQHVTLSSFSSFKLHFTFYAIRDEMIFSPKIIQTLRIAAEQRLVERRKREFLEEEKAIALAKRRYKQEATQVSLGVSLCMNRLLLLFFFSYRSMNKNMSQFGQVSLNSVLVCAFIQLFPIVPSICTVHSK